MITTADEELLRRAIGIAARAVTLGDAPYGSLPADQDGMVLVEAHNTVRRDNDISAHPELKLAHWAARELNPDSGAWPTVPQDGPALFDEARVPVEDYYRR